MPTSRKRQTAKKASGKRKQELKAINRMRGLSSKPNMSAEEARIIYKALRDKTPHDVLLKQVYDKSYEVINKFSIIDEIATHVEGTASILEIIKNAKPQLYESVCNAKEYLDEVRVKLDTLYEEKKGELTSGEMNKQTLDLVSLPIINAFDEILSEVFDNTDKLLITIQAIYTFHGEVAQLAQVTGIEKND